MLERRQRVHQESTNDIRSQDVKEQLNLKRGQLAVSSKDGEEDNSYDWKL